MILSAEALVAAAFTTSAVNAKITTLNTLYGVSAAALATVANGWTSEPKDSASWPLLTYWVGDGDAAGEVKEQGKRDVLVMVRLLHLSHAATIAASKVDLFVQGEALWQIMEALVGTQHGSTARSCADIRTPAWRFAEYQLDGSAVRQGGELRFGMLMRWEGV